ncbi:23S rRNA (uracil(1939)-C(5))-methyltransferase RlmD [candidate division KSB1 bacterium 4484_87]|nr:MAG: 23S rRNA (uracil(1939)-C(5))-methyltransferase RlmD [candidate division KSB1 bacterium 4484_87]
MVDLEIESLALGGKGVAHVDGYAVFVRRALPRQRVRVQIVRPKKSFAEARVLEILKHSPEEVVPPCQYFGTCGGCLLQNLSYDAQLQQKQSQVEETIKFLGGFDPVPLLPILPSPDIFFYRNKMEYSFSPLRWLSREEIDSENEIERNFALGLHVPNVYDKVVDIHQCHLLSEQSNELLNFIRDFSKNSRFEPYTTKSHTGYWRFLVFRETQDKTQIMINIVTADDAGGNKAVEKMAKQIQEKFPFVTTMVHNINRKKAQIAFGDEERVLFGKGFIEERLGNRTFRISANSFFQTNSRQAERLYELVVERGDFRGNEIVYDLYSGTGSIGIFIADKVKKVVGFEIISAAIRDAQENAKLNHIDNCEFVLGDIKDQVLNTEELKKKFGAPDVVIIDPPRSGMHPKVPGKIIELSPEKIIYVSCNPATLARDLKILCEKEYRLISVQPVDMFPHTAHVETVAVLTK